MCAKHETFFLTPDLPHPAPPTWLLGSDPPQGKIFFSKTPHMCVHNDQCNEGVILRYIYWGTWDPSPPSQAAPLPPPRTSVPPSPLPPRAQKVKGGRLVSGLSRSGPHAPTTNHCSIPFLWSFVLPMSFPCLVLVLPMKQRVSPRTCVSVGVTKAFFSLLKNSPAPPPPWGPLAAVRLVGESASQPEESPVAQKVCRLVLPGVCHCWSFGEDFLHIVCPQWGYVFCKVRVGQLSLCSQMLLLPCGACSTTSAARRRGRQLSPPWGTHPFPP